MNIKFLRILNAHQLNYKGVVWIGVSILVTVGSIAGILLPQLSYLETIQTSIITTQHEKLVETAGVANLVLATRRSNELNEAIATLNQSFIAKDDPLSAITHLEDTAANRNLRITIDIAEGNVNNETDSKTIEPRTITMKTIGTHTATLQFINDLTNDPLRVQFNEVVLSANADDTVVGLITVTTFWK